MQKSLGVGFKLDWRLFLKVLVASTFISGAVASLFLYPIRDAGHVAAWVQAIGVIGAVAVAIWVPLKSNKDNIEREREKKRTEVYEMVRSIYFLALQAERAMMSSTQKIAISESPIRVDRLMDLQNSFSVLMGKDIPAEAINFVFDIQCEISYQISAIELNNGGHNNLSVKVSRAYRRTRKVAFSARQIRMLMGSIKNNSSVI